MFNVVVSKVIVTRFKLQKCLIAAFRANINRESQKFYTIAEKKKESIRSSAMERTKERMHSFLNYETNEEKQMHSFLNYETNEEKRRHSFLNYRCFAIASL